MKRSNGPLFWKVVVTGFGLGYTPKAPGTAGALGALGLALVVHHYASRPDLWLLMLIAVAMVAGIAGANCLAPFWGEDPSKIVIDEVAGMWISLLWIPFHWMTFLMAFILFRFFDIVKPLGIRQMEKLRGGIGVMMDDVAAGVYANLLLQAGLFISGFKPA